jgi:hypothetical protein
MEISARLLSQENSSVSFCRRESVEKLLREIPGSGAPIRPFEALVRVKIARGVPVGNELVAVRAR